MVCHFWYTRESLDQCHSWIQAAGRFSPRSHITRCLFLPRHQLCKSGRTHARGMEFPSRSHPSSFSAMMINRYHCSYSLSSMCVCHRLSSLLNWRGSRCTDGYHCHCTGVSTSIAGDMILSLYLWLQNISSMMQIICWTSVETWVPYVFKNAKISYVLVMIQWLRFGGATSKAKSCLGCGV